MVKLEIYNGKRWEVMKIVLLFFCAILGLIIFAIILLILSSIKLNIEKANISNFENGIKKKKLKKEFLIYVELHLFGKIRIARIELKHKIFKKAREKLAKQSISSDMEKLKEINIVEIIKKLRIKIENINLEAQIGIEDVILTVGVVTVLSAILGIIFRNAKPRAVYYNIMPLYQFGNSVNFRLNCIISVKMVHIIHVIYILFKKGRIKNERTSNRRSYDYSYE